MTIIKVTPKLKEVTFDLINETLLTEDYFEYEFPNKDVLFISVKDGLFYEIGAVKYLEVCYGVFDGEDVQETNGSLFAPVDWDRVIEVFLKRLNSEDPSKITDSGLSLEDIRYASLQRKEVIHQNEYNGDDNLKKMILDSLRTRDNFEYIFNNRDVVRIRIGTSSDYILSDVKCVSISTSIKHTKIPTIHTRNDYFPTKDINIAIDIFIEKTQSKDPAAKSDKSRKLKDVKIINEKELCFHNYYDYLELMLIPFWSLVLNETPESMGVSDIVTAHGDKCYCYKNEWEEINIPFHQGALLYLLSYANKMCVDRSKVCEWVIEKYPEYISMIEQTERQVLKEVYGVIKE